VEKVIDVLMAVTAKTREIQLNSVKKIHGKSQREKNQFSCLSFFRCHGDNLEFFPHREGKYSL
jgi:hypothetical protein